MCSDSLCHYWCCVQGIDEEDDDSRCGCCLECFTCAFKYIGIALCIIWILLAISMILAEFTNLFLETPMCTGPVCMITGFTFILFVFIHISLGLVPFGYLITKCNGMIYKYNTRGDPIMEVDSDFKVIDIAFPHNKNLSRALLAIEIIIAVCIILLVFPFIDRIFFPSNPCTFIEFFWLYDVRHSLIKLCTLRVFIGPLVVYMTLGIAVAIKPVISDIKQWHTNLKDEHESYLNTQIANTE